MKSPWSFLVLCHWTIFLCTRIFVCCLFLTLFPLCINSFLPLHQITLYLELVETYLSDSKPEPICSLSSPNTWTIEVGGLHVSPKLDVYTPRLTYRVFYSCPRLNALVTVTSPQLPWIIVNEFDITTKSMLFASEWGSVFEAHFALRCFQRLLLAAWLLSLPCRTTHSLEATARCSSRTRRTLLSNPQQHH